MQAFPEPFAASVRKASGQLSGTKSALMWTTVALAAALPVIAPFSLAAVCPVCTSDSGCPLPPAHGQPPGSTFIAAWVFNYLCLSIIMARVVIALFAHFMLSSKEQRTGEKSIQFGWTLALTAIALFANFALNIGWIATFSCNNDAITARTLLLIIVATGMITSFGLAGFDPISALLMGFYVAWTVFALYLNQDVVAQVI